MPRPSGGKNYAPLVRSMVANIMLENKDKLRRKLEQDILDDPIRALKDLQWLCPKDLLVEHNVTGSLNIDSNTLTSDILREAFSHRREPDETGTADPSTPLH